MNSELGLAYTAIAAFFMAGLFFIKALTDWWRPQSGEALEALRSTVWGVAFMALGWLATYFIAG